MSLSSIISRNCRLWWRNGHYTYARFIVGIQLGSAVSYKADGFPLMKCFPQTINVDFFSASWQTVKFFRLIFDSHWILLSFESSSDLLLVVTMLGKRKNPAFSAFFCCYCSLQHLRLCCSPCFREFVIVYDAEILFLSSHKSGNKTLHNPFGNDRNGL